MAVTLIIAGVAWFGWRHSSVKTSGGIGTKMVAETELSGSVYEMPGNAALADRPLSELNQNGWEKLKKKIVVEKSKRLLSVYVDSKLVKRYFIALGRKPVGDKVKRDDGKTPEGVYYVCNKNPGSAYELSLLLSYPNVCDANAGLADGLIDEATQSKIRDAIEAKLIPPQDTALGSHICIHGGGIGQIASDLRRAEVVDWTQGCVALRSEDIQELYGFADTGTPVEIRP
jgi:murein L,D-transpeptidase YafK